MSMRSYLNDGMISCPKVAVIKQFVKSAAVPCQIQNLKVYFTLSTGTGYSMLRLGNKAEDNERRTTTVNSFAVDNFKGTSILLW